MFVRELVGAVRDTGRSDVLPESIENVIASRIETLSSEDRLLLSDASVLGTRFELEVLADVLAVELEDVASLPRWERLAEFVFWESPDELRFRHDLVREVLYEAMSTRRRRDLHDRVGKVLERRGSDSSLLSLHFLEAQRYERAWVYARKAGERARLQHANVAAAELYERALAAADHIELPSEEVAETHEALGDVAMLVTDYNKAATAYERARGLGGDLGAIVSEGGQASRAPRPLRGGIDWFGRASAHAEDEDTSFEADIASAGPAFSPGAL